jgi:peptidoglycan/LPS O-acetylase OafA/YrhL
MKLNFSKKQISSWFVVLFSILSLAVCLYALCFVVQSPTTVDTVLVTMGGVLLATLGIKTWQNIKLPRVKDDTE